MIAFVVLVSVFMFLVYRKRMNENFGPGHMAAIRRGTLRTPSQYYRNPFSYNTTMDIPYTRHYTGPGIQRGRPLGPERFSPFTGTVYDSNPARGYLVQGRVPNPRNALPSGGYDGNPFYFDRTRPYSTNYARI